MNKKTLKMTSYLVIFRVFYYFFNITRKNSKTSKVNNQRSVLNLYIFYHFPKSLDRTLSKIHRQNLKNIFL